MIKATPIIDEKFWIVSDNGEKVGVLRRQVDNKFLLSTKLGEKFFKKKEDLTKLFGADFFQVKISVPATSVDEAVHGFPASCKPYNPIYNIQKRLPLFTKSDTSKSIYCAGYYGINFEKGWVKSFCPKLITIERYQYIGPFTTELELRQAMANLK